MSRLSIRFGRPRQATKQRTKTPAELTLVIERLSHEGRGVARYEGKTIFVSGALPGETVQARITERHKRYDEAECIEVTTPSAERVNPPCDHYHECGGCQLQHLTHSSQISYKQQSVLDQLERISSVIPEQVDSPLESASFNYRRACRIGLNQLKRNGELIVGFRRPQSNKLVNISTCPVLDNRISQLPDALRQALSPFAELKHLTHAEVSIGDSTGYLSIRSKKTPADELMQALELVANEHQLKLVIETDKQRIGETSGASYTLPAHAIELPFSPGDFLQVNADVNQAMINRAIEWLDVTLDDQILDLFAGLGNFSLPVAKAGATVTGVEGSDEMVKRASDNAKLNQLSNCSFHRADLSRDFSHLPWFKGNYNKILLDPPRTGALEAISQLGNYGADKILYISCNPSALARDAGALKEQGYQLTRFCAMDMFPHTTHVESMALFEKR